LLASEIPAPLPEVRAWGVHLLPVGSAAAWSRGLFTPGGRHGGRRHRRARPARPLQRNGSILYS
jgi:hypothetical protein